MIQWYFAYGSNLWLEQMTERTGRFPPGAAAPRVARLPNFRLAFNMRGEDGQAFANLMSPGNGVLGVVYCCSPESLVKMDAFEKGYQRGLVRVALENGDELDVITYFAEPKHVANGIYPQAEYLQKILRGARQHGLSDTYIREIEELAKSGPDLKNHPIITRS